jgi:hypothetical protein
MRKWVFAVLLGCVAGFAASALPTDAARAGVPRSCVHPQADPLACARATREVTHQVLPAARVRALRRQHRTYERVAPREDRERNRTLESIDSRLRCTRC